MYQSFVHPFYPVLLCAESFGHAVLAFLQKRSVSDSEALELLYDKTDASWLALLFAVLACGVQFSVASAKERDLRSKVFSKTLPAPRYHPRYCKAGKLTASSYS